MNTARGTGEDSTPVIACDLGGDDLRTHAERWMRLGRDAGLGGVRIENGLRILFRDEPAVERELRALTLVEGTCCAWARWEVCRADAGLVLNVRSTPDGAEILNAMFGKVLPWARLTS
jgi:hypothetical protein